MEEKARRWSRTCTGSGDGCGCTDSRTCWHGECTVVRVFLNGRVLLQNRRGYVMAAGPSQVAVHQCWRMTTEDQDGRQ